MWLTNMPSQVPGCILLFSAPTHTQEEIEASMNYTVKMISEIKIL